MKISRLAAAAGLAFLKRAANRLSPEDRSYLARQLMRDRFHPTTRALGDLFGKSLLAWKNKQYDVDLNGEALLLQRLRPFKPAVLFDIGANVGEWSRAALDAIPTAHVHAFEIAPATAKTLTQDMARFGSRITINTCGLGAREGEIKLYFSPESSTAASTVPGVVELSALDHGISRIEEVMTRITTGDRYLQENRIAQIDLLKIDVEGAEWDVLEGFSGAFADRKIQMVQFEYGLLNLRTRKLLGDYWQFFTERGFAVGKLYPEGVAFKTFDVGDEDFVGPNFIACLNSRADLIEALRCEVL